MKRVTRSGREYDGSSSSKPKPKPPGPAGPRFSAAERAIIERQRALASQMGGGSVSAPATVGGTKKPSSSGKAGDKQGAVSHTALTTQQRLLQQRRLMQARQNAETQAGCGSSKGQTISSLASQAIAISHGGISPATTTTHRRPGAKSKDAAPVELTAQQAVAAARARVGVPSSSANTTLDKAKDDKASADKKRKASILSKLTAVKAGGVDLSMTSASSSSSKYFKVPEMEDYWRNLRNWNLLKDIVEANQPPSTQRQQHQKEFGESNDGIEKKAPTPTSQSKTLPDMFESYEHYASAWALPCLAEARAQILSEVLTEIPYMRQRQSQSFFQQVQVQPLKKDVGGRTDYVTLQLKRKVDTDNPHAGSGSGVGGSGRGGGNGKGKGGDEGFRPSDVVFLGLSEHDIRSVLFSSGCGSGDKSKKQRKEEKLKAALIHPMLKDSSDRRGLVGTCEVNGFKATVDGLAIKVSRRIWTELGGPEEMCLMKLGSNVTGLREFGALCQVKHIPLLQSLLTGKDATAKRNGSEEPLGMKSKAALLQEMGGSNALGKGFAKFAETKFNESQLEAIASAAKDYGSGGFTLVKGPPGTGKTTTLAALVNSLHIKQFNKYYEELKHIATGDGMATSTSGAGGGSFREANRYKPRILVCAPSNAAVDNIIMKIMEDGFIDGNGQRYNPSMVRVGSGQSSAVQDVSLASRVDTIMGDAVDAQKLQERIMAHSVQIRNLRKNIYQLQRRARAILDATPWDLPQNYEVRIDESSFDQTGKAFFVNHKDKSTSFEIPPPPESGEKSFPARSMPEFRAFVAQLVKLIEKFNLISGKLEQFSLLSSTSAASSDRGSKTMLRQQIETHILDSVHVVLTTLGTAGSRALDSAAKFEVVIIDEAAQSVEPATLPSLQLGSSHAILVGDPQQLPATIFSVSGKTTKYDRSLFQRLEEAGHPVHMLNTQYRMHPEISDFPRRIFYKGALQDGPNVQQSTYGQPLLPAIQAQLPLFRPFTILDLESSEERGGTSLSNSTEANFALHLYNCLNALTNGMIFKTKVAIISPYSQQVVLLRRTFGAAFGDGFESRIEINTVDGFQGRESNIVIFSAVRAAGSKGIGFLSDVRRMNVALTRAKYFMFVIARCRSIVVNPYWRDLVAHAREMNSVLSVLSDSNNIHRGGSRHHKPQGFPDLTDLRPVPIGAPAVLGSKRMFPDN